MCQQYAGVVHDSIVKKRNLSLDVVEMLIGASQLSEEQELNSHAP
jgi:hypothetical protein